MTEIKPYMCSCCNDIWSRENQKNIKLGKYELHLCPDCYREYIISNNMVFDKIKAEVEKVFCISVVTNKLRTPMEVKNEILQIIDRYKSEVNK